MRLNELSPGKGAKKEGKRLGRGHSAGEGNTCGRGQEGQHCRSGQCRAKASPERVTVSVHPEHHAVCSARSPIVGEKLGITPALVALVSAFTRAA